MIRKIAGFIFILSIIGCQSPPEYPAEFYTQLDGFLNIVKTKDWEVLYSNQSDRFQDTVPYSAFRNQMEKNRSETDLINYQFLKLTSKDSRAFVETRFSVKTKKFSPDSVQSDMMYRAVVEFTRQKSGSWKLENVGLDVFYPVLAID